MKVARHLGERLFLLFFLIRCRGGMTVARHFHEQLFPVISSLQEVMKVARGRFW